MDDIKLRALLTSVRLGSFSKAALQLDYTQSGLTHMMNRLEQELGCTILERTSGGVKLTEDGEHLLPYIENVLSACDALSEEAAHKAHGNKRRIKIGCFPSISRSLLPDILSDFGDKHPEIQIDVFVEGESIIKQLSDGNVQLSLVDDLRAEGFEWIPLYKAPLVAVVPKEFEHIGDTISLNELYKHTFLTASEQYINSRLPDNIKRINIEASDDASILSLIESGLGVSVLSGLSMRGYEAKIKTIELEELMYCTLGIAMKSMQITDTAVKTFVDFLKNKYLGINSAD